MTLVRPLVTLGAAIITLAGCTTMSESSSDRVGQATLTFADGRPAGTMELMRSGDDLSIQVSVRGISPGAHGFHLHTTGKCDAPDFTSAGGHLNPYGRHHGTLDPMGPHLGDMRNIQVGADGTATATVDLPGYRSGALDQIFDADGTAVIVHAGADDYKTDPSGDAGGRLACGIVQPA